MAKKETPRQGYNDRHNLDLVLQIALYVLLLQQKQKNWNKALCSVLRQRAARKYMKNPGATRSG